MCPLASFPLSLKAVFPRGRLALGICTHVVTSFSRLQIRSLGKWPLLLHLGNGSDLGLGMPWFLFFKKEKAFEILHPWEVLRLHFWIISVGNITTGLCLPVLSDRVAGITNAWGRNFRKGQDTLEPVPVGRNSEFSQESGELVTGFFFFIRMLTFSWSGRAAETFCRTATRKGAHQGPPSGFLCLQLMFARQSLRMKDGAI